MRRKMTCQLGAVACMPESWMKCTIGGSQAALLALTTDVPPYLSTTQGGASPIFARGPLQFEFSSSSRYTWRKREPLMLRFLEPLTLLNLRLEPYTEQPTVQGTCMISGHFLDFWTLESCRRQLGSLCSKDHLAHGGCISCRRHYGMRAVRP